VLGQLHDVGRIEGASHMYDGHEEDVARVLARWLRGLGPLRPSAAAPCRVVATHSELVGAPAAVRLSVPPAVALMPDYQDRCLWAARGAGGQPRAPGAGAPD
jgi:hypothetical protein